MGLETGDYISDLVITNPTGSDSKTTADDHIRLIKKVVKQSFPNISAAVTCTAADLNILSGLSQSITAADFARLAGAGETVTGYVAGVTEWLESDVGANSNAFTVSNLANNTWVLIGPTTYAGTSTWTALDTVGSGAKWIRIKTIIKASNNAVASGEVIDAKVYGRKGGSVTSASDSNRVASAYLQAAATATLTIGTLSYSTIPIDSNKAISLYRSIGTNIDVYTCVVYLCGWGR